MMPGDECDPSGLVGRWVGPCQVMDCLRRGKRTTVYRAWQPELQRPLALKVLNPDRLDARSIARFRQEADLVRRLDHPHVVYFYAAGEQDFQPYLLMEWVEGRGLDQEISRQGRLSPERAAGVALDVARALDYIHGVGIVHRDVKPSNILLGVDGDARLTDFGIAGKVGDLPGDLGIGSAAYLAPEQLGQQPIDPRSDIYSLGIVLFEMLVGQPPFQGEDEMTTALKQLYDPPPALREYAPGLDPGWEKLVRQALAKSYWERPSARALAEQIQKLG